MDNSTTELITSVNITTSSSIGKSNDSMDGLLSIIYVSIVSTSIFITIIIVIMSILSERKRQISPQGKKTDPHKKRPSALKKPSSNKSSSIKPLSNKKSDINLNDTERTGEASKTLSNSLSENVVGDIKPLHDTDTQNINNETGAQSEAASTVSTLPPIFEMIREEKRPKKKRKKKRQKQLFETIEESVDSLPVSTIDEDNTVPNVKKRKKKRKHKDRSVSPNDNGHINEEVMVNEEEEKNRSGTQIETRKNKKKRRHRKSRENIDGEMRTENTNMECSESKGTTEDMVKNREDNASVITSINRF